MRIKISAVIHYILIYILFIFTGSIGFRVYNDFFVIFGIVLGVLILVSKRKAIPNHYVYFLIVLSCALLIEIVITNGGVNLSSCAAIIARFMIILAAYYYDEKNFCIRFVKLSVILAFISLIGFAFIKISPNIMKTLFSSITETISSYWGKTYTTYYGKFIFCFQSSGIRNIGIYHEPGLYQIVLNATLFCLLYESQILKISEKKRVIYIVVIVITELTTLSTTGYLVTLMLFVIFFVFSKNKVKTSYKVLILALGLAIVFYDSFSGTEGLIYKTIISKIFNSAGSLDLAASTGRSRIVSFYADIEVFVRNPFGIGYANYNNTWSGYLTDNTISDTASCVGITQILAILGIGITGIILFYYGYLSKKHYDKTEKIAFWFLFFSVCFSQPQIWYPPLIVLLLINKKKFLKEENSRNSDVFNYSSGGHL